MSYSWVVHHRISDHIDIELSDIVESDLVRRVKAGSWMAHGHQDLIGGVVELFINLGCSETGHVLSTTGIRPHAKRSGQSSTIKGRFILSLHS